MRLLILLSAFLIVSCSNNRRTGQFELKGQFTNTNGETIYLDDLNNRQPVPVDSTQIENDGSFEFTRHKPSVGFYRIRQSQQNFATLVLDSNDKVTVTGDLVDLGNTYKVEGSRETDLFLEYGEILRRRDTRLDSINSLAQIAMEPHRMDAARLDSVTTSYERPFTDIQESANRQLNEKVLENTDRYASIMAIQSLDASRYAKTYKSLADGLRKKFPGHPAIRSFGDYVDRVLSTTAGQEAPDIRLASPDGKELALSDYRGKVVLVDFWASWCGPCRREMPNVVRAYEKYKSRGFEIFGVSLDQDHSKWVEAIRSDGMTWPQVSDLRGWQSAAAQLYNVQSIPYTVLVDAAGKIITTNLRGADLEKKLEEVLSAASGS